MTLKVDDRGILVACPSCGQTNRVPFEKLRERARCGKCKTPLSLPAEPLEVNSTADFDRLVARSSLPVVVDFWAPWCGPCHAVAPELAKVAARSAGRDLIVKVNTDALTDLGERYRIRSIPTMAVFAGGTEVARTSGARPASDIEAFIARATQ
jgi:thioredoxin 2